MKRIIKASGYILYWVLQLLQFVLIIVGLQYLCDIYHIKRIGIFSIPYLIPLLAFVFLILPYVRIIKLENEIKKFNLKLDNVNTITE